MSGPDPERIRRALRHGHTIDITTTGRRTGQPRRIEIVFHAIDGRIYISGSPHRDRKRAWILNLEADPHLTVHLKGPVVADLPAVARVITEPDERRALATWITEHAWRGMEVDALAAYAPMIEVTIEDAAGRA